MSFINSIYNRDYLTAANELKETMNNIKERKLNEMKMILGARTFVDTGISEQVDEIIAEARIRIVKARIRNGKIQRRKKISNIKGFSFRGGQLQRLSVTERRNRRMGQRRGKIKRRAKMARTLMKRTRSLRKRKSLGIK